MGVRVRVTQLGLATTPLGLRLHRLRSRGHKVTRSGVRGQGARFQRSGVKSSELSGQRSVVRGSEVRSQIQGSVGIWSDLGDHPICPFAIVVHPHAIAHFRPHLRSRGGGAQGRGWAGVGAGVWGRGRGSGVGVRAWARVTAIIRHTRTHLLQQIELFLGQRVVHACWCLCRCRSRR